MHWDLTCTYNYGGDKDASLSRAEMHSRTFWDRCLAHMCSVSIKVSIPTSLRHTFQHTECLDVHTQCLSISSGRSTSLGLAGQQVSSWSAGHQSISMPVSQILARSRSLRACMTLPTRLYLAYLRHRSKVKHIEPRSHGLSDDLV